MKINNLLFLCIKLIGDIMVVIDAYRGGDDIGYTGNGIKEKDFNLNISKYIDKRLKELGINTYLTRDTDTNLNINQRSDLIKDAFSNNSNVIAISNRLNYGDENGVEIMYSLKNSNALANKLEQAFNDRGISVNKVYQRRDENDTSKDYDDLLKNTGNIQTIVISYGYINNETGFNNYVQYAEPVIKVIADYYKVPYTYTLDNEYIVKKGDSLWSISRKYNTSVDELKRLNNLTSNTLRIGQILKLPSSDLNTSSNTYTVAKGDSLWSVSRKFGTTVDELKKLNNLTSNVLSIGQILIIPGSYYIVEKGDSLWSISRKYNTTVDNIKKLNNLSTNILSIGQKLIIK